MKRSSPVLEHGMHFRQLLAQVRATVLEAGCADRLDAEAWLANWLCTPNPALGGALPPTMPFARYVCVLALRLFSKCACIL